ncbi:SdrD B-like domain-containing protein [Naasia lichenicola]|uniref:SdrD B-like domain-containing protein n=1 Tax=Naasia lichenicola TaxID=2565933 RepID=UPI00130E7904|nr:SdrD B-like domain-containing protein [Naasia lichenicola]
MTSPITPTAAHRGAHAATSDPAGRRTRRIAGLGIAMTLAAGSALGLAAPAHADPITPIIVQPMIMPIMSFGFATGTATIAGSAAGDLVTVTLMNSSGNTVQSIQTDSAGNYSFIFLSPGDYYVVASGSSSSTFPYTSPTFTVPTGSTVSVPAISLELAPMPGSVTITGDATVGSTLTGTVSGFPAGAAFTYQWGYSAGESGGPIDDQTGSTLMVTDALVGKSLSFFATATKAGFSDTTVRSLMNTAVTAAKKAPVSAPASDAGSLSTYLTAHQAAPITSSTVGLPASLSSEKSYTANLGWNSGDSFVDVYAYSSPTFIGTFPVSNGTSQITLSAAQLAALGGGSHTLVAIGQSSGGVQSVALSVSAALASTGFDPMLPMGIAAILLLLGGSLLFTRRAQLARAATAE